MAIGVAQPKLWENIGSKISFWVQNGVAPVITVQPYPTYYAYRNGVQVNVYPQAATPAAHFYPNPYPFGTVPCPTPFGNVPGGRCGDAASPADASARVPPSGYTQP